MNKATSVASVIRITADGDVERAAINQKKKKEEQFKAIEAYMSTSKTNLNQQTLE